MSLDFRVKIDKVEVSEADRKITVYCFYTPREATEEDKDAFRRKLAARSGFDALEVVFRLENEAPAETPAEAPAEEPVEAPAVDFADNAADDASPLPEPPVEEVDYNSAPVPQYDEPAPPEEATVDAMLRREEPAPEEAPVDAAPARMPETVVVDFSEADYQKEQEALIRADSRSKGGYYPRGGEDGGAVEFPRAPGAGFYNGRGDGKRNKRTRIAPPEGEEPRKDADGNVILIGKEFDAPVVRMIDLTADSGYVAMR
ncbi:MAG: hypothetical protein J6X19_03455, partial [Clostridia bacterium]|nr:hypothetical protein [Clostridia bacterium]